MYTQSHNQDFQYQTNPYNIESPNQIQSRLSQCSEFNQISPIVTMTPSGDGIQSLSLQNDIHKPIQGRTQDKGSLYASNPNNKLSEYETPNSVGAQEFYRQGQQIYYGQGSDIGSQGFESNDPYKHSEGAYSSNRGYLTGNFNSIGLRANSKGQKEVRQGENCNDFDLTAKEISSNKRLDKANKNTIISGRVCMSPNDEPPSNSDTEKWAFTNKDSQETQKKVSVINRESINAQALISKSLKSHDFQKSSQQSLPQSNDKLAFSGKALNFANINDRSNNLESGLLYGSHSKSSQGTLDSQHIRNFRNLEENKLISFLEDETELLNSLKKHHAQSNKNRKFLVMHRSEAGEPLQCLIENSIECALCNQQKVFDESLQCSVIEEPKSHLQIIKQNLDRKYLTSRQYYNVKIINDIIYNEQTHIVSVFKDYLIYDDISEFLKRFYNRLESDQRLPRMYEFYEKYSKVFPNYVTLPENKYLFKNIEKKQRIIDEKQRIIQEKMEKEQLRAQGINTSAEKRGSRHRDRFSSSNNQHSSNASYMSTNRMFDTRFINSVANIQPSGFIDSMQSSRINNSRYQDHLTNSSILIQQHLKQNMDNAAAKRKKKNIEDLDFDELISKFIAKDSESNIQQSTILPQHPEIIAQPVKENKTPNQQTKQETASTLPTQKKPQVYEYQQKKPTSTLQPQSLVQSDNSKSISEIQKLNNNTKQAENKRLSSGSQKEGKKSQEQIAQEHKILNYNIYNNYNQFINNENYYISNGENQGALQNEQETQQLNNNGSQTARGGTLQRNLSRQNHHSQQNSNKPTDQTPLRGALVLDQKTPQSNQKQNKEKTLRPQSQLNYNTEQPNMNLEMNKNMIPQGNTRSVHSQQKSIPKENLNHRTHSPSSQIRQDFGQGSQTCRAQTEALVSREMSKEKRRESNNFAIPNSKIQTQVNFNGQQSQQPQMFKNDLISQITQKQQQTQRLSDQQQRVRSVDKLKSIEDEIQQDYSKYVNEYGLTQKTAFAKAVNQIREKEVQSVLAQTQSVSRMKSQQQSNEKKRHSSQNQRSNSHSQARKTSKPRNQVDHVNDEYMRTNKNDQRLVRSVRATTHLNSQNSSVFQRSNRLSPDKYGSGLISLGLTQNLMKDNQASNYITLKAQQSKQAKGIKIKLPANSNKGSSGKDQNTSKNQTPKRIKLQKTKSTSNIPLYLTQKLNNQVQTSRVANNEIPNVMMFDDLNKTNQINPALKFLSGLNMRASQNTNDFQKILQLNDQQLVSQPFLQQQNTLGSSSCGGTYTTTSILNSPLGFKNPVSALAPSQYTSKVSQQAQQQVRNNSKGKSSSRNGTTSQHQSTKSIGATHQRATSNNALQGSNNKRKSGGGVEILSSGNETKRMSAGSNMSRKSQVHHQSSSSNVHQQILQLLMSYQSQQHDNTGDITAQSSQQQFVPLSQTLRNLQQNQNIQSMKDLKTVRQQQPSALIKDLQIAKSSKNLNAIGQIQKQPSGLSTQRSGAQQPSIIMINQNNQPRKASKSGKNTSRETGSKKRVIQQQNIVLPYQQKSEYTTNSIIQNSIGHQDLSSRIQNVLMASQIGDITNITNATSNNGDAKTILSYSKSQENLDIIKMAAQKAIENSKNTDSKQSTLIQSQISSTNKFLQNLKQQQETQQMSLSKMKLMPSSTQTYQLSQHNQQPLQSARNPQLDPNIKANFGSNLLELSDNVGFGGSQIQMLSSRGPTNIIINQNYGGSGIGRDDKGGQSSRRTSGNFKPSSSKNH